jgi:hypothetical protein
VQRGKVKKIENNAARDKVEVYYNQIIKSNQIKALKVPGQNSNKASAYNSKSGSR